MVWLRGIGISRSAHGCRARVLALSFALLVFSAPAFAHPHMSLDSKLVFEFEGRTCVGFRVEWLFDPLFSGTIIGQYDANRDGRFDAAENEKVRLGAFSNLRKYGYFLFLRRGGARSCPDAVEGFTASQRDGRLVYNFRVPLRGKGYEGDFSVAVFDSTFYCAVRYATEPAVAVGARGGPANPQPSFFVAANKRYPVYYNPFGAADDFRVYDKWQQGLSTAYPEEISVHFSN